jgi:prepilin-type processing-associated H-X9-DG protein
MKPLPSSRRSRRGSSLIEVAIVMGVLVAGAMLLLPMLATHKTPARRISCVNRLKQVGTAFRLFANDYDGKYPFQVLAGLGTNRVESFRLDPLNTNDATQVWKLFQAAGNELSSPRILVCPADAERTSAQDFNKSNLNAQSFSHPSQRLKALSYFYGLNAREDDPNQLVTGDRNLTAGGSDSDPTRSLLTGQVDVAAFAANPKQSAPQLRWGLGLHDKAGNIGFSDGHVEQLTSGKLREAAKLAGTSNNIVWLPNLPQPKR